MALASFTSQVFCLRQLRTNKVSLGTLHLTETLLFDFTLLVNRDRNSPLHLFADS